MADKYLSNLIEEHRNCKKDLLNIRSTIFNSIFDLYYCDLKSDLEFNDTKFKCIKIKYKMLDDIRFTFYCTYIGNINTVLNFEYEDGWFCTVIKDLENPKSIISECENINKFCIALKKSLH